MGQRPNDAAVMVALTWRSREECAEGMEQRSKDAAAKDAGIKLRKEEFAKGTGHIPLTSQLHLIYHVNQHVMKQLQPFPISTQPQLPGFKMQVEILLARFFAKLSITLKSKELDNFFGISVFH